MTSEILTNEKELDNGYVLQDGWIRVGPQTSVEFPQFEVPAIRVGRLIALGDAKEQKTLCDFISNEDIPLLSPKIRAQPEMVQQVLSYFLPKVDAAWASLSSFGAAVVRETPRRLVGFAVEEILNLAFALWCSRQHPDIEGLFKKLQSDHLRGSLLEIQIATNLIQFGHSIRIEPNLSNNTRSSDIHLELDRHRVLIAKDLALECRNTRNAAAVFSGGFRKNYENCLNPSIQKSTRLTSC
jgi:hypothetical protein